jgi:hypothetical protein
MNKLPGFFAVFRASRPAQAHHDSRATLHVRAQLANVIDSKKISPRSRKFLTIFRLSTS